MSIGQHQSQISMIEVDKIHVPNPRIRNKKQYKTVAENVIKVGLKRPITVTSCKSNVAGKEYDLVCGQGRLEIFIACGEKEIPALVINASEKEMMVMSIVENMARRHHTAMDLMKGIELLKKQGYCASEISAKTGMGTSYVRDISKLIEKGEERLISAVEAGLIPIGLAAHISDVPEKEQQALQEAYETKSLRGRKFIAAKRILEARRLRGKSLPKGFNIKPSPRVSTVEDVLAAYKQDVQKKKILVRKSEMVNDNLFFIIEALRRLYSDDNFNNLLKAEGLNSFPRIITEILKERGINNV